MDSEECFDLGKKCEIRMCFYRQYKPSSSCPPPAVPSHSSTAAPSDPSQDVRATVLLPPQHLTTPQYSPAPAAAAAATLSQLEWLWQPRWGRPPRCPPSRCMRGRGARTAWWREAPSTLETASRAARSAATSAAPSQPRTAPAPPSRSV